MTKSKKKSRQFSWELNEADKATTPLRRIKSNPKRDKRSSAFLH